MAPLGDDLTAISPAEINGIGFPASEYGQAKPSGARYVGDGEEARGIVIPMDHSRLGSISALTSSAPFWFALGGFTVAAIMLWRDQR